MAKVRPQLVKLVDLVEDESIYPRNRVDDQHANDIYHALQADAMLPPIIVDAGSMKVIDGYHRLRAWRKYLAFKKDLSDTSTIQAELHTYADDAAMFLDAIARNATHGRKLDRQDHIRVALVGSNLGISTQLLSLNLNITPARLEKISLNIVVTPSGDLTPAKRGMKHMRGQQLTDEQLAAMRSVRTPEAGRIIGELRKLLEADMVDATDEHIHTELRALVDVVQAWLQSNGLDEAA